MVRGLIDSKYERLICDRWNQGAIDDAYQRWQADPASVDQAWRAFFEGFALAERTPAAPADASAQLGIFRLVMPTAIWATCSPRSIR